jgi:hypothetical protein
MNSINIGLTCVDCFAMFRDFYVVEEDPSNTASSKCEVGEVEYSDAWKTETGDKYMSQNKLKLPTFIKRNGLLRGSKIKFK